MSIVVLVSIVIKTLCILECICNHSGWMF